jgi:hypothetical protein
MAVKQYSNPLEGLTEAVGRAEGCGDDFTSATRSLAELHDFAKDCLRYTGNIPTTDLCSRMMRQAVRVSEGCICGPVVELALQVLGESAMLEATGELGWLCQEKAAESDQGNVGHVLCTREHLRLLSKQALECA